MTDDRRRLGLLTGGSLLDGLDLRLEADVSPEQLRAGQYVVLEGEQHLFYTMIDDVRLASANPAIGVRPPSDDDGLLRAVLAGESTYLTIHLRPLLQLPRDSEDPDAAEDAQVKTVPAHFRVGYQASDEDVARVFGDQRDEGRWHVGTPLDMASPVCLRLDRFVERSNGIFGKTGTGKTFLTRLMLAGLMHKAADDVVSLVFDMHNEYGNSARQEGSKVQVPGLRKLFGSRVAIYTLDKRSTERRGGHWDEIIQFGYDDLEPADLFAMRGELGLTEAGCDTIGLAAQHYPSSWLKVLLDPNKDAEELADELHAHPGALQALRRKLQRLTRLSFLHSELGLHARRAADDIVERMANRKQHVVLEFGGETSLVAYLLVANVLTRRIYERWIEKAETYHASGTEADRPPQLVICVEEAHKFLNTEAAKQTSFGQIARELRKYFVSLLIVDQRPSGIDDEILSQLGTRITAQLSDDRDIQAVLAGTSNAAGLRVVLAGLDSKQQALVFGHAVPMPVVLRTRSYDELLFDEVKTALKDDVNATMSRGETGRKPSAW